MTCVKHRRLVSKRRIINDYAAACLRLESLLRRCILGSLFYMFPDHL
jgi:hypothetical protein